MLRPTHRPLNPHGTDVGLCSDVLCPTRRPLTPRASTCYGTDCGTAIGAMVLRWPGYVLGSTEAAICYAYLVLRCAMSYA
eukprot:463735-Rhodomonas_salina.1